MVSRVLKKAWDFLGSRDLSVFIFIMGLTYTLFLIIFGVFVSVPWVSNISRLLPFKVLYLLFFVNLIICEIKWIPVIIRRCRKPNAPASPEELDKFRHKIAVSSHPSAISSLELYLRSRSYTVKPEAGSQKSEEENVSGLASHVSPLLYGYKGRFSPVGNLLFHFSFLVLLVGVGASFIFRFSGTARVPEGFDFTGSVGEYAFFSSSPLSTLPPLNFTLDKIEPRFWEERLLFTDLRADIVHNGGKGSAWMSSPITIDGTRVTINSIGITPMYLLRSKDGKELDRAYVNLAAFAPGTEDHFQIPGYPHQIFVSFYPDYEVRGGKAFTRSMDLKNPAYSVRVFRGRLLVYSGLLKPGEEAEFESLKLSFPEMRYWGEFRIVKDPGFLFIWTAFTLFATGLVWRLIFYKLEVVVVREGDEIYLYGNSDYYHNIFEDRLKMFARMIGEK